VPRHGRGGLCMLGTHPARAVVEEMLGWLLRTDGGRHRRVGAHLLHCGPAHCLGQNWALLGRPARALVEEILGGAAAKCGGCSGPAAGGTVAVGPTRPTVGSTVRG
jgi:hypothetical protein